MPHLPITPRESPPLQPVANKPRKWYRLPKVLSPSPKVKDGSWSPAFRSSSFTVDRKSDSSDSVTLYDEEETATSSEGDVFEEAADKDAPLIELEEHSGQEKFASLTSQDSLREALNDPIGLAKFGAFLASELGVEQLCFWLNAQQLSSDLQALQSLCRRVHDLHIPTAAPLALNLSNAERNHLLASSSTFQSVEDPFARSAEAAFQSMHQDPWSRFVKLRLTLAQKAFIKRSQRNRDSFCLVDLREGPEQIIGMASKGFQTLTGYSLEETLSMNCRVLQGPDSSPAAVARVRKAIELGADTQELMINYTKAGAPFWVLLQMACLRDETGAVRYILGHQLNLTSQTSDLSWLLGDNLDVTRGHASEVSELHKEAVSSSRSSACTRLEMQTRDRNKRLQDAAALAFEATSARHSGPGHARERHSSFEVRRQPTSACAPLGILGATSSKVERGIITGVEQVQHPTEIFEWRNKSPAKLIFLDPETLVIRFSSPSLPLDWAQGQSFADLIEELNPPGTITSIRKQIARQDFFSISPKLRVFPPGEAYVKQGRTCPLAVTPLLDRTRKVGAVVIMFGW